MTTHTVLLEPPVLLLGGSGRTGRRVADRLRAHGRTVRIGSRQGDPPFAWDEPAGWPALLAGVEAATSRTRPTSRCRRPRASCASSVPRPARRGSNGWCCCPVVASRPRPAARPRCGRPGARSRSSARAGSRRTSPSTSCSDPCSRAWSRCRRAGTPRSPRRFVDVDDVADVVTALLLAPDPRPRPSSCRVRSSSPSTRRSRRSRRATGRPVTYLPLDVADFVAGRRGEPGSRGRRRSCSGSSSPRCSTGATST